MTEKRLTGPQQLSEFEDGTVWVSAGHEDLAGDDELHAFVEDPAHRARTALHHMDSRAQMHLEDVHISEISIGSHLVAVDEDDDEGLSDRVEDVEDSVEAAHQRIDLLEMHFLKRLDQLEVHARKEQPYSPSERVVTELLELASMYKISGPLQVAKHLEERALLYPLLKEVAESIRLIFEVAEKPTVFVDEDNRFTLTIETSLHPTVAQPRFSTFLRDVWMPKSGVEDKVTVTLDYV